MAELKSLTQSLEKERADQVAIAAARRSANEAYRMMTELPGDRRLEGMTALSKIDQSKLDPLERQALADRAAALRHELGQTAFERGKAAFRRNEWAPATEDLTRFLAMQPSEPEQLEASFMLGNALVQQRKYEPAIAPLKQFVEKDRRSKNREWAMTLLAQAYEQTGKPDQAAAVAREALGMYPASQFTPMLKARLNAAKRALSGEARTRVWPRARRATPRPRRPRRQRWSHGPRPPPRDRVPMAAPRAPRGRPGAVQDRRRVVGRAPAGPRRLGAGAARGPALTEPCPAPPPPGIHATGRTGWRCSGCTWSSSRSSRSSSR